MDPHVQLGRLESIDPREAWSSEAGHFTPWLASAENVTLLGDAIGLELEVEAQEKSVGPFRADILCRNTLDGSWVLIENQLERTDHSHLGQLLTYAAGLDAVTIVWIARRITEEHRAALDWLNRATHDKINFLGLEIELWRIGSSPLAPKFNVVSQPNDWARRVQEVVGANGATPTRQQQQLFWTQLRDFAQRRASTLKFQKPSPQNWMNLPLGRSGVFMTATVNMQDGELSVQLVLNSPRAKMQFRELQKHQVEIERLAGLSFDWLELTDLQQSRQIELNYDLRSISAERFWCMLPREFHGFMTDA